MLLPTMVLLSTMLLTAVLLSAMLLASMPARISTITRRLGRGRHMIHTASLQVYKETSLIRLGFVLQSKFPTHLLHSRFNLLHMSRTMIPLAYNNM
jgi:hypothetical protein